MRKGVRRDEIQLSRSTIAGFCSSYDLLGIGTYCPAHEYEFRSVEPSFAEFEFRDKCLTLADTLAQFGLGDTGILSSLHKQLDHSLIEVGTK